MINHVAVELGSGIAQAGFHSAGDNLKRGMEEVFMETYLMTEQQGKSFPS
jgi:hypothetical protein